MERVLGIGGVFVRSPDPARLASWYRDHLGVAVDDEWGGGTFPLQAADEPAGSYAVWAAFPADTDYFGSPTNQAMVNFRVRDLAAMLAQLQAAGCDVADETEDSEFGRFGWVTDHDGNRVELWQPPDTPVEPRDQPSADGTPT